MKTLITISTLVLTITIVLSSHIFTVATDFLESEKCEIYETPTCSNSLASNNKLATMVNYYFDEEEYINDIPFNTNNISAEANYLKAIEKDFDFEQESFIDDIPFNTIYLVQNLNNATSK
ncbi:MAG TPA: hypothetical protein QF480_02270 [Bacteroidales bacterium]|jgi:hypothetical protein|nr:hypothetical protein [Bacteroidales bacterium]|tara:strand:+ start:1863 stop:2222 length:360 start_codon:yes stop_codon:yes gene_type:complete